MGGGPDIRPPSLGASAGGPLRRYRFGAMISLLIVNYRSAPLAIDAIISARSASSAPLQVIVVDNSIDPRQADLLRPYADQILVPEKNLGYGGGINAGRTLCTGQFLIVSNPDVVFGSRSIDHLVKSLESGAAVAGPALYWDHSLTWMLPPSETHTAADKLDQVLASRSSLWSRRRDRRRTAQRLRFWSLQEPAEVPALSGAVMAIQGSDFDQAGGFDERFALYFEETDFLRRLTQAGKRIVYVPSARCRHLYNQSAGIDPGSAARAYAASELLFLSKWYGSPAARLLKALERPRRDLRPVAGDGRSAREPKQTLVEASPLGSFETAAGHFPESADPEIPEEVWSSYLAPVLYFRTLDRRTGRVLKTWARRRID